MSVISSTQFWGVEVPPGRKGVKVKVEASDFAMYDMEETLKSQWKTCVGNKWEEGEGRERERVSDVRE